MKINLPASGSLSAAARGRLATASLLLAALLIMASVILAPPPLLAGAARLWLPFRLDPRGSMSAIAQSLPLLAALLGLTAGLVARRSGGPPLAPAALDPPHHAGAEPHTEVLAQLAAAVQDVRELLVREGRELSAVREGFGSASHEAMVMSARLAGAAMDAEERLAAGVARAERSLQQPTGGTQEPVARLAAAADTALQTWDGILQQAASNVAGYSEAANGMRRDAAALGAAAREITLAGAGVVSRLSEATGHVLAAAARLPDSAASIMTVAQQAAAAMADGLEALRSGTAVLDAAGGALSGVASACEHQALHLSQAGSDIATAGAAQAAAIADAATEAGERIATVAAAVAAQWKPLPGLDRIDTLGERLEGLTAGLSMALQAVDGSAGPRADPSGLAWPPPEWSDLSAKVEVAVGRLQDTANAQEVADQRLALSLQRVQDAAEALVRAAADVNAPHRAAGAHVDGLAATLRHVDRVDHETAVLSEETEALAEAVLSGHAGELSALLADRTPALLIKVEAAICRLRSAATALALASDGPRRAAASGAP